MRGIILSLLVFAAPVAARNGDDPVAAAAPAPEHAGEADKAAVLAVIDKLFAALKAKDPAALAAVTIPQGRATASYTDSSGQKKIGFRDWGEFGKILATIPGTPEEKLIDPHVHVDGDIAMIWSAYTFTLDGKFSHCGTDHVDLVRTDGEWRVLNLTWTQKTQGCAGQ